MLYYAVAVMGRTSNNVVWPVLLHLGSVGTAVGIRLAFELDTTKVGPLEGEEWSKLSLFTP